MKTKDLLLIKEHALSSELKQMKLKELEKHATNIANSLGENNYEILLAELIKLIPTLPKSNSGNSSDKNGSQNTLAFVKDYLKKSVKLATNDSTEDENKLTRLTVILMLIVSKKFNTILKDT